MKKDEIPRLRTDLELFPVLHQGERVVVVKDFLGLIPQPLVLNPEAVYVLGLIDGSRSVKEIQIELRRQRDRITLDPETVDQMLTELRSRFILESPQYRSEKARIIAEYADLPTRPAALAGQAYPASPEECRLFIAGILDEPTGTSNDRSGVQVRGLVAPHIDLEIGRGIYRDGYRMLRGLNPKKIILIGTGHHLDAHAFCLTSKDFVTPLGRINTDKAWVKALQAAAGDVIAPDDMGHRKEHSLEFQLLFLQYLFGRTFDIVPILFGSWSISPETPMKPGIKKFYESLQRMMAAEANPPLIVAGVDLSHIGLKFGHPHPASVLMSEAREHDFRLLRCFCKGDEAGFWDEHQRTGGRFNVCGLTSMAGVLALLPGLRGKLRGYDFWEEEPTQSAVSFAAVSLECD